MASKRRHSAAELTAEAVAAALATAAAATAAAIASATTAATAAAQTALSAAASAREHNWLCGVCKDLYNKPTTVSCGHTFCLECINQALAVKEECPVCRAGVSRTLKLAINPVMQEFISDNAGPMFIARKAEKTDTFYKALIALDPKSALTAISPDVDLSRFVGNVALKLTPLLWACTNVGSGYNHSLNDDDDDDDDHYKNNNWIDLIKVMLTMGVDVNARDSEGNSVLLSAIKCNHLRTDINVIPALLDRGAHDPRALSAMVRLSKITSFSFSTIEPIDADSGTRHMEFIDAFTLRMKSIDAVTLRLATDESYLSLPKDLAQQREDLTCMLKNGLDLTALQLFKYQGVRLEKPEDMLYWAAAGGCPEFIRKLLTSKVVDVDHIFVNSQTALHVACSMNKFHAAIILLDFAQSYYFHNDDFLQSPASYARRNGMSSDLIDFLDHHCA